MLVKEEIQEHLSVNQILAAILILTQDEKFQLQNLLPIFLSDNGTGPAYLKQELLDAQAGYYENGGELVHFDELSPEHKANVLNERLEDVMDIQLFKSVEAELEQLSRGKRPDGWLTWDELQAELDALDEAEI
ncbi:MAG: hypothetical protein AAF639_00675 [Chloroflexota bacterium]